MTRIALGLAGVLMLTLGLVAIAIACSAWSLGSVLSRRALPLTPGARGFASEPICGGAVSTGLSALHGETVTPFEWAKGCAVLAGVLLLLWQPARSAQAPGAAPAAPGASCSSR